MRFLPLNECLIHLPFVLGRRTRPVRTSPLKPVKIKNVGGESGKC